MKKILMLFVLGCWQTVYAANGGGTVVGNGAGFVESSFQQAYASLQKIIPLCRNSLKCETLEDENKILDQIIFIINSNANKKDRLVFLSEKLNPGFFTTGTDQTNRIAKTFLTPESSIYINTDMLYTSAGKPAITFQDILRILVHELGHQTGLVDHAPLDMLGVKVSVFSEDRTYHYRFKLDDGRGHVSFSVTNMEYPTKSTLVLFNWRNQKAQELSESIILSTSCTYESESYAGIEVINGHFDIDNNGLLSFQAWVNLHCFETFSGQIFVYRKNLSISLDQDYQIMGLKVK